MERKRCEKVVFDNGCDELTVHGYRFCEDHLDEHFDQAHAAVRRGEGSEHHRQASASGMLMSGEDEWAKTAEQVDSEELLMARLERLEGGTSHRASLLREAESLVCGDRNNTYGEPHQDFARTAGVLSSLGYVRPDGGPLKAHDVAVILAAVKLSRLTWSPGKRDSWVDLAGYAACGHEAYEMTKDDNVARDGTRFDTIEELFDYEHDTERRAEAGYRLIGNPYPELWDEGSNG